MKRQFKFTKKLIDSLPPCPASSRSRESEFSDTDVAGLRLLVNRLGRKFFLLRYSIHGRKRSMKLGDYPATEITNARQMAIDCRSLLAKGIDPQARQDEERTNPVLTFRQLITEKVLPHAYATKRSARDDESRLNIHVLPIFGDRRLDEITTFDVQKFHNQKKETLCPATANRIVETMRRAYNLAMQWGLVEKNPVSGIRFHQENNKRHRYLSGDELKRFLQALESEANQVAADLFRFLLMTGARREEAIQARWDDVDLLTQQWRIPQTKSGRSRHVFLNAGALEVLSHRQKLANNPFIFTGAILGKPINNPVKAFARVLKHAAINDFRIHDLRHTHASIAINNGASLYEVQHLLGHASSTTTSRYAHLANSRLQETSQRVGAIIGSARP